MSHRQVDGAVFMGINKEEPGLTEVLESDLPAVFIDGDPIGKLFCLRSMEL